MSHSEDTIFALSTAPGRAAIAVLRASGPNAGPALSALAGGVLPPPRHARLTALQDPASGEAIDEALVLWFPAPNSFTGEDMAEFHLHGGRAVVEAGVAALLRQPGLRPAEAGEFTRRAFHNGRLDLTEVEGLADLIDAETPAQRRQALRQLGGGLAELVDGWRERLLRALAHAEAAIDFPDEDLPQALPQRVLEDVSALSAEIDARLADRHAGERLRQGLSIAIVGPPNAGKSSLLNALARRDAAIVSETAGTTRDVVEVHLDLAGYPVMLADTAGLRAVAESDAASEIEREGMRRARARAADADLVIAVFDLADWPVLDQASLDLARAADGLVVLNKLDRHAAPTRDEAQATLPAGRYLALSARSGAGVDALLDRLEEWAQTNFPTGGEAPVITRARHRQALEDCAEGLRRALAAAGDASRPELMAEDLRLAMRALGRVTGSVDVEDLLDVIFRDFCIGK